MSDTYQMSTDDFPNGCFIRHDICSGKRLATGENKLGIVVTVPLDTPLCSGCDGPLDNWFCADCETVVLSDGFVRFVA